MQKKLSIFVIWGNFPPVVGGGSTRGYRIYKNLANRGHKVTVFVGKIPGTKSFETLSENLTLYRIPPAYHYPLKKGFLERAIMHVILLVRYITLFTLLVLKSIHSKPDIMIVEGITWGMSYRFHKYLMLNAFHFEPWVIYKRIFRIPTIIYFTNVWCSTEIEIKTESKYADTIVIVDRCMIRRLKEWSVIKQPFYAPVSIDINKFSQKYNPASKTVLFVGRLSVDKAPHTLIKAIPRVVNEVSDVIFKIVGEGDEEARLKSLVDRLGVKKYVDFVGPIPADRIIELHADARTLVNPVRSPGISNVVLEAMASGLPVIKSKYPDYDEDIVVDGKNGYSFEVDNPDDLAEKLIKILKADKTELERMSANARKTAIKYDINTIVDDFEGIILKTAMQF